MSFCVDLFSIIQAITTSIGIILGGVWTYVLFVRQRLAFPRVNLQVSIDSVILPQKARFIHAEVSISNVGSIMVKSEYAELRLRQISPISDELRQVVEGGYDPVPEGKAEIEWPMIAGREWRWNKDEFEVEPGESDSIHADFIIPLNVQIAEFYFFIANAKKKQHGIGWTVTKIDDFTKKEGVKMSEKDAKQDESTQKGLETFQQKKKIKQKQQQQQQQQQQNQPKKNK